MVAYEQAEISTRSSVSSTPCSSPHRRRSEPSTCIIDLYRSRVLNLDAKQWDRSGSQDLILLAGLTVDPLLNIASRVGWGSLEIL